MKLQRQVRFGGMIFLTAALVLWLVGPTFGGPKVDSVGTIGLTVSDLDRSVAFFARFSDSRKFPRLSFTIRNMTG